MSYDLTSGGLSYGFADDVYRVAGSTYKVPLNMYYYDLERSGELSPTAIIRGYRLDYIHRQSLVYSNNDVSDALWLSLGTFRHYRELMAQYCDQDYPDIFYRRNRINSAYMNCVLKRIYDHSEDYAELLAYMKSANPNQYFKQNNQPYEIAHKYGAFEGAINDVGIIYTDTPYILSVYTQGVNNAPALLGELCALITQYTNYWLARQNAQESIEAVSAGRIAAQACFDKIDIDGEDALDNRREYSGFATTYTVAGLLIAVIVSGIVYAGYRKAQKEADRTWASLRNYSIPLWYNNIMDENSYAQNSASNQNSSMTADTANSKKAWMAAAIVAAIAYMPGGSITLTANKTLYAVWAQTGTMQNWKGCSSAATSTRWYLTDNRESSANSYYVGKAADGKCWMLQNLRLGINSTSLSLTTANTQTAFTLNGKLSDGKFTTADGYTNDSSQYFCRTDDYGCYYNWYTATAGTGKSSTTSGSVSGSICPAGWKLPTGGYNSNFATLYANTNYNSPEKMLAATDDRVNNTRASIPGFTLGGYYYRSGAGDVGSYGEFWSSTAGSGEFAYRLDLTTYSVYASSYYVKFFGNSVRCITE